MSNMVISKLRNTIKRRKRERSSCYSRERIKDMIKTRDTTQDRRTTADKTTMMKELVEDMHTVDSSKRAARERGATTTTVSSILIKVRESWREKKIQTSISKANQALPTPKQTSKRETNIDL